MMSLIFTNAIDILWMENKWSNYNKKSKSTWIEYESG